MAVFGELVLVLALGSCIVGESESETLSLAFAFCLFHNHRILGKDICCRRGMCSRACLYLQACTLSRCLRDVETFACEQFLVRFSRSFDAYAFRSLETCKLGHLDGFWELHCRRSRIGTIY